MEQNVEKDDIVTLKCENDSASNTFIVDATELKEDEVLLRHPLFPRILIRAHKSELNQVRANLKDSVEKCLDFCRINSIELDRNGRADLDALCAYFTVTRNLTPKQKSTLSAMCGKLAAIKFNDDLRRAMDFVIENKGVLDEFNARWFGNFKAFFDGTRLAPSMKQREGIFNIAGFVLAEMENPSAKK